MFRKLIIASCLSVFALSMAACNGPGEIKIVPTADQNRPGNPDVDPDDPESGINTGMQ